MKIGTKTTLPLVIMAALMTSAISLYTHIFTTAILKNEITKHLETTAQLIKHNILDILNLQKEKIEIAAAQTELSPEELQKLLEINQEFTEIFIINSEGIITSSTNKSRVGLDRSHDDYFISSQEKSYIKPVYFSETDLKDSMTISAPYLGGVLVARFDLKYFNDVILDRTSLGETGEILMAYRSNNGDAIFFTKRRFEDEESTKNITLKEDLNTPTTQALLKNEDFFSGLKDYRGTEVVATTKYIEEGDIGLVVKVDKDEAFALTKTMILFTLTKVPAYLLIYFFIVYFLISRVISKPINALHEGVGIIEEGDLKYKVGTDSKDEIGQLSRSFDKMTSAFRKSRFEVDKKVISQTKEIQAKELNLEKQQKSILNLLEDAEAEKTKAKRLAKDLQKFELAVENASDHIVITDDEGAILYANKAVEKITGFKKKELIGEKVGSKNNWGGLMEDKLYKKMWDKIKNKKKSFSGILHNQRKNKERYEAMANISPILNQKGEVAFFIGIERDVTKEKEIDQAKTEFVSLASHQLRTPLSTINWYAEMLLAGDAGKISKEQKEYLDEIYHGNQRMIQLVNALLNVSRLELGTFIVNPEPTNLVEIANEVIKESAAAIEQKELKIETNYDKKISKVMVDSKLMRIIVQNLISNSVKYTLAKGKIEVKITKRKNDILFSVRDSGIGIPEKQQDRIFSKLFRADNVRQTDTDGTGLGLYIVKSITEKSGGKIWFHSIENKGTTFYITIPEKGMKKKEGSKGLGTVSSTLK